MFKKSQIMNKKKRRNSFGSEMKYMVQETNIWTVETNWKIIDQKLVIYQGSKSVNDKNWNEKFISISHILICHISPL